MELDLVTLLLRGGTVAGVSALAKWLQENLNANEVERMDSKELVVRLQDLLEDGLNGLDRINPSLRLGMLAVVGELADQVFPDEEDAVACNMLKDALSGLLRKERVVANEKKNPDDKKEEPKPSQEPRQSAKLTLREAIGAMGDDSRAAGREYSVLLGAIEDAGTVSAEERKRVLRAHALNSVFTEAGIRGLKSILLGEGAPKDRAIELFDTLERLNARSQGLVAKVIGEIRGIQHDLEDGFRPVAASTDPKRSDEDGKKREISPRRARELLRGADLESEFGTVKGTKK